MVAEGAAHAPRQQDAVSAGDGHDHRRGDGRVDDQPAALAAQGALRGVRHERIGAAPAEAVASVPGPQVPAGHQQPRLGIGQAAEDVQRMVAQPRALRHLPALERVRAEEGEAVRVRQLEGLRPVRQGPRLRKGGDGGRAAVRIGKEHAPSVEAQKGAVVPRGLVARLDGKGGFSQNHAHGLPRQKNALSS